MKKVEFIIWVSPNDLDDLEKTFNRLTIGSQWLTVEQKQNIWFNVVMGISDEIIDWENSDVGIEECVEKFYGLKKILDWSGYVHLLASTSINGCTSMRNLTSDNITDVFIWLDTDIVFDPITLPHMLNAIQLVKDMGYTKFVITPEIVRQWDYTWDCLVNSKFIDKPVGYQAKNNPYIDTIFDYNNELRLTEVVNTVPMQPYMKFGGGWFTALSSEFLREIPFPKGYGHYGFDDTYLMWGAHVLQDNSIKQFKIQNLIVCENYFDRIHTYKNRLKFIDRREEYKKHNELLFNPGLKALLESKKVIK